MIEKAGNKHRIVCDHCEETFGGFDTFMQAVNYKKTRGWVSLKDGLGEWHELCPDCSTPEIIQSVRDWGLD
jgi:hypothetical protein